MNCESLHLVNWDGLLTSGGIVPYTNLIWLHLDIGEPGNDSQRGLFVRLILPQSLETLILRSPLNLCVQEIYLN